jgi:hypothetical protein
MDGLTNLYIKLGRKLDRKFIFLGLFIIIAFSIMSFPNPLTHECTPNFRTQLGIKGDFPDEPQKHYFCRPGYYPVLRFSLENTVENAVKEFVFIVIPLMGLLTVAYILSTSYKNRKNKS